MNLQLLNYAEIYYQLRGFQKLTVPWLVDQQISALTKPPERKDYPLENQVLVGSAEQSFLQLLTNNQLPVGCYVTTTPCFRNEPILDQYHQRYFLKTELIITDQVDKANLKNLIETAKDFFSQFIQVKVISGNNQFDIVDSAQGVELGSYGIRSTNYQGKDYSWIYGTGCAEPRLSTVIDTQKSTGYHQDKSIPKSKIGSALKIFEEVHELQDSLFQKNKLLTLCELADLQGAIELYLEKNHPSIDLSDLKAMSSLTQKAFKSGHR